MLAATLLNPTRGRMDNGSEVVCMLEVPWARGIIPDPWWEGFSVPERQTDDHWASREEIINHPPVVAQQDITNKVTNWFRVVEDEYWGQVQALLRMSENAHRAQDEVADELVHILKELDDFMEAIVAKQAECDRLVQPASNDIKYNSVPSLFDDVTPKEKVKQTQETTTKDALSMLMHAKMGAALQTVEETKKALAPAEDERNIISGLIE